MFSQNRAGNVENAVIPCRATSWQCVSRTETHSTSKCVTTHQGYGAAKVHFIEQSLLHSKVSIAQTIIQKLLRFITVTFNLLNSRYYLWEEMQML